MVKYTKIWKEKFFNGEVLAPECDPLCRYRSCYHPDTNKGSFSQGRGYTSYHTDFKPVCGTRQYHGCNTTTIAVRGARPELTQLLEEVLKMKPDVGKSFPKKTSLFYLETIIMLINYIIKLHTLLSKKEN